MSRKGSDDLRWPDVSDSNFDKSIFSFQFPSNQSDGQKLLIQISINQYFHFENHPKHSQTSEFDHSENSKTFSTHFEFVFFLSPAPPKFQLFCPLHRQKKAQAPREDLAPLTARERREI